MSAPDPMCKCGHPRSWHAADELLGEHADRGECEGCGCLYWHDVRFEPFDGPTPGVAPNPLEEDGR